MGDFLWATDVSVWKDSVYGRGEKNSARKKEPYDECFSDLQAPFYFSCRAGDRGRGGGEVPKSVARR